MKIKLEMCNYFLNTNILDKWFLLFKYIIDSKIPPELETPISDFQEILLRDKNIHWRAKKWCGRILQR